jgi:hypothetical protein
MERTTILNTINNMTLGYGNAIERNVRPAMEITSDMGFHKLIYHVRLTNGLMRIELMSDGDKFTHTFNDEYESSKNSTDYAEMLQVTKHYEQAMDTRTMLDLLSRIR